jgi:hypothetical protein
MKIILLIIFYRLDIGRLQLIAQIHSYYITNAKSELKFSSSNLSENELETTVNDITSAIINNNDIFVEEENEDIDIDDIFSDSEEINLDDENTDELLLTNVVNLDYPEFEDKESIDTDISDFEIEEQLQNNDNNSVHEIDFEALLDEDN